MLPVRQCEGGVKIRNLNKHAITKIKLFLYLKCNFYKNIPLDKKTAVKNITCVVNPIYLS